MKLEFKTVKEFLGFLHQDDFSFVDQYDIGFYNYLCFGIEQNSIDVYSYNDEGEWEDGSELIDTIYGHFFEDGGHISLSCDNNWDISFIITDGHLSVGSIYKIKVEHPSKTPIQEPERFIEL
jgi:hypothetical protein